MQNGNYKDLGSLTPLSQSLRWKEQLESMILEPWEHVCTLITTGGVLHEWRDSTSYVSGMHKPSTCFFFFFKLFYCCSSTFVSIFTSPLFLTPPTPSSHPQSYAFLAFCPWVLYTCFLMTLLHLPPLSPSPSLLVTVSSFFISMSLVIFCMLVWFVD